MPTPEIPLPGLFLTSQQSRAVDKYAIDHLGVPGIVLMENAGHGAARLIIQESSALPGRPLYVVLTGSGNNAGDGFVVARHLTCFARDVLLVRATPSDRLTGDARTMSQVCHRLSIPTQTAANPGDWRDTWLAPTQPLVLIDALMGTGGQCPARPHFADLIRQANRLRHQGPSLTIALDLPSGLNPDTGHPSDPTIQADLTLTFGTMKQGFAQPGASQYTGRIQVVSIGLPDKAIHASLQDSPPASG